MESNDEEAIVRGSGSEKSSISRAHRGGSPRRCTMHAAIWCSAVLGLFVGGVRAEGPRRLPAPAEVTTLAFEVGRGSGPERAIRLTSGYQPSGQRPAPTPPNLDRMEPVPSPVITKPLSAIDVQIVPKDRAMPPDYAAAAFDSDRVVFQGSGASRSWTGSVKAWEAPQVWHGPLYFEDVNLERYGLHFGCLQPAVSASHFAGQVLMLPYQIAHDHPTRCRYDLGYERPGACVPYRKYCDPIDVKAAAAECATLAGLILLFP